MRSEYKAVISAAISVAMVASSSVPALAANAKDLNDLVGARAGQAEGDLESRGYTYITGNEGSFNTKHSYWWNANGKNCVHIETRDGRYASIRDASKGDCNQKDGSGAAAAVGAVAGIALLGALLSKSHHRDGKNYNDAQTAEFERGYRDGLYNTSYHNYNRVDAYSDGYSKGVEERSANLRHREYMPNRGGYLAAVDVSDLSGARASGADDDMRRRGFSNVDSFKSGTSAYTIWNRKATHQCIQMTVADGYVQDIRDIGTHPKCR